MKLDKATIETLLTQLNSRLQEHLDSRLLSMCVFGSAVDVLKQSQSHCKDINILIVASNITPNDWDTMAHAFQWWQEKADCIPLLMTKDEWLDSQDIFALEHADIAEHYWLVHGGDVFCDRHPDPQSLRFLCELELHKKLIAIRQHMLMNANKPDVLMKMTLKTLSSMTTIARSVIRLLAPNEPVPFEPQETYTQLAQLLNSKLNVTWDKQPFLTLLELRNQLNPHKSFDPIQTLAQQYVSGVNELRDIVDSMTV